MASQSPKLHFILFPLMAQGHMIPMIDIAKLLAQRDGVIVTVITTPLNAVRFKPLFDRVKKSGHDLRLHEIKFPCNEAGLPEGSENLDMLPSLGLSNNLFLAIDLLKPQLELYFKTVDPKPSCVIADLLAVSPGEAARKLGIPHVVFNGAGCFPQLCAYKIMASKALEKVSSDSEMFLVPDLPDVIEFSKAQVGPSLNQYLYENTMNIEKAAFGLVVNTFEELEQDYVKEFKNSKTCKVWCIGPVSLCNKDTKEKTERGNKTAIDENECLKWLDSCQPNSVIYACFGSLNNLIPSQMMQLGLGLESSKSPFIWVIRGNSNSIELEKLLLEDGFEERVKGRGLLIRGWAPQVLILSHPSIGAFLTHCGWNSTLEGVSAGVPFITWPLFADQFYNEKLIVQVLGIGVRVGNERCIEWGKEKEIGVVVFKEDVEKAVVKVLDKGKEGEERREKARKFGEMAKGAMEEGGSSYLGLTLFIEEIMEQARLREKLPEKISRDVEVADASLIIEQVRVCEKTPEKISSDVEVAAKTVSSESCV